MAMVRPLATNPAQKLFFLSFTSAEGKGAPLPFWGPSQSFGFSLFPLPVSGDLRLLSANTWSPLCDPHSFLNGHFFWRLETVNSNTSSSNFISLLPVGYHVTIYIPPRDDIDKNELKKLIDQFSRPFILLGDFNSHNTLWGCKDTNKNGKMR